MSELPKYYVEVFDSSDNTWWGGDLYPTIEDARRAGQDAIVEVENFTKYRVSVTASQRTVYEMPEMSNMRECMEEFFDYAESCGVGALL